MNIKDVFRFMAHIASVAFAVWFNVLLADYFTFNLMACLVSVIVIYLSAVAAFSVLIDFEY